MLAFGFGGGICGVVMAEVGIWAGLSTLVALLVALDVFVISVPAGLTASSIGMGDRARSWTSRVVSPGPWGRW